VMLAGRAAEELAFDQPSSSSGGGSDSDLARATRMACDAVASFGLTGNGSLLWYGAAGGETSRHPAHVLAEADKMLKTAFRDAKDLLRRESAFVERVADALIRQRALSHQQLVALDPSQAWFWQTWTSLQRPSAYEAPDPRVDYNPVPRLKRR
jgi:cell division protease FtsH